MSDDVITTKRGARVKVVRDPRGLWAAVRDDGLVIYRAYSMAKVLDYVKRVCDILQPSPPGKSLIF